MLVSRVTSPPLCLLPITKVSESVVLMLTKFSFSTTQTSSFTHLTCMWIDIPGNSSKRKEYRLTSAFKYIHTNRSRKKKITLPKMTNARCGFSKLSNYEIINVSVK